MNYLKLSLEFWSESWFVCLLELWFEALMVEGEGGLGQVVSVVVMVVMEGDGLGFLGHDGLCGVLLAG